MKYLGMTIHCIGIVLSGTWLCTIVLNSYWPDIDNVYRSNAKHNMIEKKEINSR